MIYDQTYFETVNGFHHPAGYSGYSRRPFVNLDDPDDQGEVQRTDYWKFKNKHNISGKVLDLGCAYGFFVEDLRSWGIEAYGIDGSEWAISKANEYCTLQNVMEYLPTLADNSFDVITGIRFLPCLTDAEIAEILPHILRIAPKRLFVVDDRYSYMSPEQANFAGTFYNVKPLGDWEALLEGCSVESIGYWGSQ